MSLILLLLLSALQAALAIFVWRAQPQGLVHRRFAGQTLLLAIWVLSIGGIHSGSALDRWGAVAFASASLIPAAFLAFAACYPTSTPSIPRLLLRLSWLAGVLFAVLALTTDLIVFQSQVTTTGLTRRSGPVYPLFALYFLVAFITALGVFLSKWSQARGRERAQLQYLAVGITISAAGGIGMNLILPLLTGRSAYSWLGPYFSLCLVALTAHAIIRHRLMDIRLFVHRGLIYAVVIAGLAGLAIAVGRLTVADWTTQVVTVTFDTLAIVSVAILVLSPAGQRLIRRAIDPYLYRGHLDHAAGLRQATHRLSQLMEPVGLAARLHAIIAEAFVPESFAVLAKASERDEIEVLAVEPREIAGKLSLPKNLSSLMQARISTGPSLLTCSTDRDSDPQLWAILRELGVEVLVCLQRRDQFLGFLLLGPRRSGDAYYKPDLAFIEALAELASIALDNALLYRHKLQMLEYSDRLVESIESAVIAVDAQGRITSTNAAARKLFTSATPSLLTLSDLPSDVGWALALALVAEWVPREVEIAVDHPLRGALPLILSAVTLRDEKLAVVGALVVATDLSRVKALERDQRRIERLSMMARFYAGIAHEIRSPLASISNFIAMLPDRFDDPEYRDTAVRLLPSEVARIVRLADRLRSMAPSDGGKLGPVRLQPLLADIVAIHAPAAAETGVVVEVRLEDGLPEVAGDANQLVQLFVNLLRNAVEAMPSGGTVTIEARHDRDQQRSRVTVAISDEGTGINQTLRAQVFAPFFTTKPSGTGLGLTICREIVEFHGASLSLLPRQSHIGTTAIVSFPVMAVVNGQLGPLVVTGRQLTSPQGWG